MRQKRIGIAMSGGVDSTATALILHKRHDISGFLMNVGQPDFEPIRQRVTEIASQLDIELRVIDLRAAFEAQVLDYFTTSYAAGKTPNPCLVCNQSIKFGLFMEAILGCGMTQLATGHYATIEQRGKQSILLKGRDPIKDQSYFLARLSQAQLSQLIFPLGKMTKESVYELVHDHGFRGFDGQESQDVCFLTDTSVADFLEARLDRSPRQGPIADLDGKSIGLHAGLHRYTIGQRKGLGLVDSTPWYVHSMNKDNNVLYVCKKAELSRHQLTAHLPHWLASVPAPGARLTVKIRSTDPGAGATITDRGTAFFTLRFDQPQRAVAPGQYAVLYDGDQVIGSGEILAGNQELWR